MGAGTEADVWNMTPVGAVMNGFMTRKSEIRYLVMMIAGMGQCLTKDAVLSLAQLIGGFAPHTLFDHPGQHASRLY